MDKKLIFRRCITVIPCFISAVLLFVTVLIAVACSVVSPIYFNKVAEVSRYDELAFESLKAELSDLPSGLPEDFFEENLSKEVFKSRVADSFRADLKNTELSYTRDTVTKEFYQMAYDFALTQNRVVSDEAKESLSGFAEECSLRYLRYSNPSSVKLVLSYTTPLAKPLIIALAVSTVLTAAAFLLLIKLCLGRDLLKHLYFSFGSAALITGLLPLVLLVTGEIERISLTSPELHSLAVTYIEGALILLTIGAAVFLLAAVFFLSADIKKAKNNA